MDIKEEDKKLSAQFPDRPKWRRAGAKAQPKALKGMTPLWLKILLFSPLPNKKVRTVPKGERKARIRARTKVAIQARAKGG